MHSCSSVQALQGLFCTTGHSSRVICSSSSGVFVLCYLYLFRILTPFQCLRVTGFLARSTSIDEPNCCYLLHRSTNLVNTWDILRTWINNFPEIKAVPVTADICKAADGNGSTSIGINAGPTTIGTSHCLQLEIKPTF
jgi:hypothetical protein